MGSVISSFYGLLFGNKPVRIRMVGLDAGGKSTILYKLKLGEVVTTIPTIGLVTLMSTVLHTINNTLTMIMVAPSLQGLPLLVYVNKQDLPTAWSAAEMVEKLTLDRAQSRKWHLQESCATQGKGIYEGLDWLANELSKQQQ